MNLTNNPAAANTNLYSATVTMGEGTAYVLQYRYTNSFLGGWVYDYAQDGGPNSANNNNYRRIISLPVTSTVLTTNICLLFTLTILRQTTLLPTAIAVFFSVDMNGAVGNDGHVFIPGSDGLYINGMFAGSLSQPVGGVLQNWYAWASGANPVSAPAGYQMMELGSTTLYTNTIILLLRGRRWG